LRDHGRTRRDCSLSIPWMRRSEHCPTRPIVVLGPDRRTIGRVQRRWRHVLRFHGDKAQTAGGVPTFDTTTFISFVSSSGVDFVCNHENRETACTTHRHTFSLPLSGPKTISNCLDSPLEVILRYSFARPLCVARALHVCLFWGPLSDGWWCLSPMTEFTRVFPICILSTSGETNSWMPTQVDAQSSAALSLHDGP